MKIQNFNVWFLVHFVFFGTIPHTFNFGLAHYNTVFARSDTAATIYFIARVCAAFIRERRLLIAVAAREAILREAIDLDH